MLIYDMYIAVLYTHRQTNGITPTYTCIYTNISYADDFRMTSMFTSSWVCATGKLPVAHVQKLLRINGRHWVKKPPKAN